MHREEAKEAHEYYQKVVKQCSKDWERIAQLSDKPNLQQNEQTELETLKHKFNLVVSADYQMGTTNKSAVYLFDERIGPKNTDHTVSYLTHYLTSLPDFVRRLHLLDNASSTNKKCFTMAWA